MEKRTVCNCFVRHPQTPEERDLVIRGLKYAREVNDRVGILISTSQLAGNCPARDKGIRPEDNLPFVDPSLIVDPKT